jgi:predicted ATPase
LATVLAYFAGAYRDRLQSLETELCEVLGTTGQIRTFPDEIDVEETEVIRIDEQLVPRTTKRKRAAHRFEVEVDGLGSVPGDLLSEGTLMTLGLLAILHQPDCPRLLLLDDIDQGLHPDAQAKLVATLRRLLANRPDVQIICTSHSPYLLDNFRAEEVQVMTMDAGHVTAARLDRHEDWSRWEGKLQTGEFWQSVGENWVGEQQRGTEAAK